MSFKSKMTIIADKIRILLGITETMGLDAMAENIQIAQTEVDAQNGLIAQISDVLRTKVAGIIPSGTKGITENGLHDVTEYASIDVNVSAKVQEKSITPTIIEQTVTPDSGYDGLSKVTVNAVDTAEQATPTVSVDSNGLITASAVQEAGYVAVGTKSVTKQLATQTSQTITPGTSNQTISAGKYLTGEQTILGDINLVADNIKNGVSIFNVAGTLEPNVPIQRATGTVTGKSEYIKPVYFGFKPDIVVFPNFTSRDKKGKNGYSPVVACFSETGYFVVVHGYLDGDKYEFCLEQIDRGFNLSGFYVYSESSAVWVGAEVDLPYIAIKYT